MTPAMVAIQFVVSCLALGLGLFLLAGAYRELRRHQLLPVVVVRGLAALAGTVLVAGGAYVAGMAVPL